MIISPQPLSQANSIFPYEVNVDSANTNPYQRTLLNRDKAEQIAQANNTTVLARATPTYTADQVIAILFDGNSEHAVFMHSQQEFDHYKTGIVITAPPYNSDATYPVTKFIKFVKFAGANLLANVNRL